MNEALCDNVKRRRAWQSWGIWVFAIAIVATLVASLLFASRGTPDPTEALPTSRTP